MTPQAQQRILGFSLTCAGLVTLLVSHNTPATVAGIFVVVLGSLLIVFN